MYWLSPAAGSADTIVVKVANTYLIYEPLLGIAVLVALLFTICRKQALPTWQHMRILDKIFSLTVLGTILSTLLARQVTTVRIAGLPWFAWLGWLVNFSYLAILVWICKQIWLWWENFQPDSGPDERSGGFQPIESFEQLFLQRQKLAEEIADIIIAHDVNEPLSICVAGPWGVGKTSVVNGAIHRLKQKSTACQYECLYVHAMELDTLVSLFSYVFSRIRAILKKHGAYVGIGSEYRKFLTAAVGKITDASIATLLESRLFPSSDDYRTQMKDLETCISAVMKGDKILVIVDDVERCEAKKAQQFIFFIKEIATMRNCIAIFLADYEYLKQTLSFNAEKDEDERRRKEYFFFEKFFNCRIDIPPVTFEDAIEKLEAEVAGPAQKLGMRTPAELFLRFEQKFKYQAERYREQANGKKDAKERDYMLSCAEELDQLSGLLRSNLSVPRMLVKYYHEMKRVYSRLIKQYAENGMLKEKTSRFFLRIRFDEIAFLLTYIEVCAPYEAFCLKEQGVTYLQYPEDPVSLTRKLIRKLGEDMLYRGIDIYIDENEAYRYSEAIQFTEAYIRGDIPKEVGKFSSRDELWINAIKSYDIPLIEENWEKMVKMVVENYAWKESEKGKEYLKILLSFARERFVGTTDGIDRVFSIFNRSQRNDEVFSGHIAVMSIFETELGGALAGCSQKNVKVLEQFSKVYFEEQNIHTMSADGELMMTILASYAQEESRSASENQKWRVKEKFKAGVPWSGSVLGYKYSDGAYIVKPDEAEIVQSIFTDYLSGMGIEAIMKKLNAEGKTTRNGNAWTRTCVRRVLSNYSYTGNLLLQTTFRENHITKKTLPNRGELPMYHVENAHEAIVSMEDFQAVQDEIARRSAKHNRNARAPVQYPFTKRIVCGTCGGRYRRKITRTGPVWICSTFNVYGKSACPSKQIPEGTLERAAAEALGLDDFDADVLRSKITAIRAKNGNDLVFYFRDGTERTVHWTDRSRSESWTPEMKTAAREYARKGQVMRKCQQ